MNVSPAIFAAASAENFFVVMELVWFSIVWLVLWFIPICGFFYLIYFLISLPMRRQERARFFLDLIETGIKQGRSVESSIVAMSESRDTHLPVRFHLLAAHLEKGLRLRRALEKVPRLLPPQIVAMLQVGEKIGDVKKILPACRGLLKDGSSQTRGAMNYLIILLFLVVPIMPVVFWTMKVTVMPKFKEIFAGMDILLPPLTELALRLGTTLATVQLIFAAVLYLCALFYAGGPRFFTWIEAALPPISDWFFYRISWRRKRMQRDFSMVLALLLDAEIPEEKAVTLAAQSTANYFFIKRSQKVIADLRNGKKLTEAVLHLDDSGEFKWRLTNAVHAHTGFLAALSGWFESLDAKAFQEEQRTAQLITTGVVFLNGAMVALLAIGMFQPLVALIEQGVLW